MKLSNLKGLSDKEVEQSRSKHGSNHIEESAPPTFFEVLKEGFGDPMIRLLCAIAVVMIAMFLLGYGEVYEPLGIMAAIALVTVISAKTSMASDKEYRKLKSQTKAEKCTVYRNNQIVVIDTENVVVGDLIIIQSGDKIPADGVLIQGDLRVDNSSLNGEAEECKKTSASSDFEMAEKITGDTFVDKHSLFKGTTVFNGEGVMEVRRVGMNTMMGQMAEDMKDEDVDSPLKVKLSKLAGQISKFGYIGAIVISLAYMTHFVIIAGSLSEYIAFGGVKIFQDALEALTLAIVIVVCAVPRQTWASELNPITQGCV